MAKKGNLSINKKISFLFLFFFFFLVRNIFAEVDPLTGSYYMEQSDLSLRFRSIQIFITRDYNSISFNPSDQNAAKWLFHPFPKSLTLSEDGSQLLLQEGRKSTVFEKRDDSVFVGRYKEEISFDGNAYTLLGKDGKREVYDRKGRLVEISYPDTNGLIFLYSEDNLEKVLSGGREILRYITNTEGRVEQIRAYNGAIAQYSYDERGLLSKAINEIGITTSFHYDDFERLTQIQFQTGDFVKISYYTDTGIVKDITRKDGTSSYSYGKNMNGEIGVTYITHSMIEGKETVKISEDRKIITHMDVMGHQSESHHNDDGLLVRYIDANGNEAKYEYDSLGRLVQITQPDSGKIGFSYSGETSRIKEHLLPDGSSIEYFYNDRGQLIRSYGPGNTEISYTYNDMGLPASETYGRGEKRFSVNYVYNESGFLIEESDSLGRTTKYKRDSKGQVTDVLEPSGRKRSYQYNDLGFLSGIYDSGRLISSYQYDDYLRLVNYHDERGLVTKLSYDDNGHLNSIIYPDGLSETYEYSGNGKLKSYTNAQGDRYSYKINSLGYIIHESGPHSLERSFSYDALGNLIESREPDGQAIKWQYDSMNRIKSVERPGGLIYSFEYDRLGRLTEEHDPSGHAKRYSYDHAGQLAGVAFSEKEKMTYRFDPGGSDNVITAQTSDGNNFQYEYDSAGRLIREITPWNGIFRYFYDHADNLVKKILPSEKTVHYQYDSHDRPTRIETSDGYYENYEYNQHGDIVRISGKNFDKKLNYNNLGDLLSIEYPQFGKIINYSYDEGGNRVSLKVPGLIEIYYAYDKQNRLATIDYGSGQKIHFSYDKWNRKKKVLYDGGMAVNYSYDDAGLLSAIEFRNHRGEVFEKFQYEYNKAGWLIKIIDLKGETKNYSYDPSGQLLQYASKSDQTDFEYGLSFKRIARIKDGKRAAYVYSNNGQLIQAGDTKITYDDSGHISGKADAESAAQYHFDSLGRLSRIQLPDKNIQYAYFPQHQRIQKTSGDSTSYYVYDGDNLIMELDHKKEPVKIYVHALGIDSPLAMIHKDKGIYLYLHDHQGSIVGLADQKGKITTRFEYQPFGDVTIKGEDIGNPFTFTGRFFDLESGLYYYRARYYDPELGIFLSPDQKTKDMAEPRDFSPYLYCGNDPVNSIDPYGLQVDWTRHYWHLYWQAEYGISYEQWQTLMFHMKLKIPGPPTPAKDQAAADALKKLISERFEVTGPPSTKGNERIFSRIRDELGGMPDAPSETPGIPQIPRSRVYPEGHTKTGYKYLKPGQRLETFQGQPSSRALVPRSETGLAPGGTDSSSILGRAGSLLKRSGRWLKDKAIQHGGKVLKFIAIAGTAIFSYLIGNSRGEQYVNQAVNESRTPTAADKAEAAALAVGEATLRTFLAAKTFGASEGVLSLGTKTIEVVKTQKSLNRVYEAQERARFGQKAAAKMTSGLAGAAVNYLKQAKALKEEQDAMIREAASLSNKIDESLKRINGFQPVKDLGVLCDECRQKRETLLKLIDEMNSYMDVLLQNRDFARDKTELICLDSNAENAKDLGDMVMSAATLAKNQSNEAIRLSEMAGKLYAELDLCTTKIRENNSAIDKIGSILNEIKTIEANVNDYVNKLHEALLFTKNSPGKCVQIQSRVRSIYESVKASPGPDKDIVSDCLTEVQYINEQMFEDRTKSDSYDLNATGMAKIVAIQAETLKASYEKAKKCELGPFPQGLSAVINAAADSGSIADKVKEYADEALECLSSERKKPDKLTFKTEPPGELIGDEAEKLRAKKDEFIKIIQSIAKPVQVGREEKLEILSGITGMKSEGKQLVKLTCTIENATIDEKDFDVEIKETFNVNHTTAFTIPKEWKLGPRKAILTARLVEPEPIRVEKWRDVAVHSVPVDFEVVESGRIIQFIEFEGLITDYHFQNTTISVWYYPNGELIKDRKIEEEAPLKAFFDGKPVVFFSAPPTTGGSGESDVRYKYWWNYYIAEGITPPTKEGYRVVLNEMKVPYYVGTDNVELNGYHFEGEGGTTNKIWSYVKGDFSPNFDIVSGTITFRVLNFKQVPHPTEPPFPSQFTVKWSVKKGHTFYMTRKEILEILRDHSP